MNRLINNKTLNKIALFNFILLIFYCSFIYWMSDRPSIPTPMIFPQQDKIFHGGAYFIMGMLAWRSFKPIFSMPILTALVFCSLFGASDEWHQTFVEGRFAEFADWFADTMGAGIGILFFKKFFR